MPASEWRRKAVHAGMGLFALTLRWLDWKAAAAMALAALLFNFFVLPRIGRGIYRDAAKAHDTGILAYPAMVLVLLLLFGGRYTPIAAAVWAMMALGDPAAAVAGKILDGPKLPWNREKTWIGLLSNWAASGFASVLVFRFVTARDLEPAAVAILMAGAGTYAFLESVRSGIDDNLVAALPTGLAVYQMGALWPNGLAPWSASPLFALLVNTAAAGAALALDLVVRSGALAGAIAGFLVLALAGWRAYAILWAFFLLATAATRLGYGQKSERGLAQARRGRRGAAHVVANCAVPVALLLLGVEPLAFVAAFAAALSDTLGTEIGTLYGRKAFSPLTLRDLPPGTVGAVSWPGTAASLVGAVAMGALGGLLGLIPAALIWAAALGGFLGALSESLLADLGRHAGYRLDHDFANAWNTFAGALAALGLAAAARALSA